MNTQKGSTGTTDECGNLLLACFNLYLISQKVFQNAISRGNVGVFQGYIGIRTNLMYSRWAIQQYRTWIISNLDAIDKLIFYWAFFT